MSAALCSPLRHIPREMRLQMRSPYGSIEAMLAASEVELAEGRLANGCAALHDALSTWLRRRWIEIADKNTEIIEPRRLLDKLRSGKHIDEWTYKVLGMASQRPAQLSWEYVDILFAIVHTVTGSMRSRDLLAASLVVEDGVA